MASYYFQTEALAVGYHHKTLISDIDIKLAKGDILTLIGPNGSGKSTILKSLTKHLKTLGGVVYLDQEDLHRLPTKKLSEHVAVLLTERMKVEFMTCWDLVATGRYPYTGKLGVLTPNDHEKVKMALSKVNALSYADRNFNEISDGQKQRILLARAICQEPDIIVLDEPTSFLDVRYKLELLSILKEMSKSDGITIVMSLHEIDLAQKISDQVMCVKGDKIYKYGKPSEIFSDEIVKELYEIDKGSYNSTFGSVELKMPFGHPTVFVIAGDGTGIPHFRELQRRSIAFCTGILHNNDIDCQIAKPLASELFYETSFEPISDIVYKKALNQMKTCQYVLYSGVKFGTLNAKNKNLLEHAVKLNIPVINSVDEIVI